MMPRAVHVTLPVASSLARVALGPTRLPWCGEPTCAMPMRRWVRLSFVRRSCARLYHIRHSAPDTRTQRTSSTDDTRHSSAHSPTETFAPPRSCPCDPTPVPTAPPRASYINRQTRHKRAGRISSLAPWSVHVAVSSHTACWTRQVAGAMGGRACSVLRVLWHVRCVMSRL
jgi:hypothetical protein